MKIYSRKELNKIRKSENTILVYCIGSIEYRKKYYLRYIVIEDSGKEREIISELDNYNKFMRTYLKLRAEMIIQKIGHSYKDGIYINFYDDYFEHIIGAATLENVNVEIRDEDKKIYYISRTSSMEDGDID